MSGAPLDGADAAAATLDPRTGVVLDKTAVTFLVETFSRLYAMCHKTADSEVSVDDIRLEIAAGWKQLRKILASRVQR